MSVIIKPRGTLKEEGIMREARTIRFVGGGGTEMSYDLVAQTGDVYTHARTSPEALGRAVQAAAEAFKEVMEQAPIVAPTSHLGSTRE